MKQTWKRWAVTLGLLLALGTLAVTVDGWLPPLLAFVGANTDLIQGLEALAQIGLGIAAVLWFVIRVWMPGTPNGWSTPPTRIGSPISAQDRANVAVNGGVAGGVVAIGGNQEGDINIVADPRQLEQFFGRRQPTPDLTQSVNAYLTHLVDRYRYLDIKGMGVSDRVALRLPLMEMYVPLKVRVDLPDGRETWQRLRLAGRAMSQEEADVVGQRASEPQPAIEMLRQYNGLIILGDPGAGKTTFLKYLTLLLSTGQGEAAGLAVKLPILVPLSAYANRLAQEDIPLDRFIGDYHQERGIPHVAPMLAESLAQGGALILLDGLDEVKEMGQRRLVVDRVADFFTVQQRRGNKFILTSRIVGYREVRPTVEGLVESTLVDFDEEEIRLFVEKWTQAIERAAAGQGQKAAADAQREKTELLEAIRRNPGVQDLAANPLLLTILALMKRQGVTLPERRVELYEKYVSTLLGQWNMVRGLGRPPSRELDVAETLRVLAPLALWMHQTSPGVGLVPQEDLRRKLEAIYTEQGMERPEQAAVRFLADVREHAGLLLERGHRQYGFIHLTFQEYLAGVALALEAQEEVDPLVTALAQRLGDANWHEVSLLAVGQVGIVQQRPKAAGNALLKLMEQAPDGEAQALILAGEAVADVWPGGVTHQVRDDVRQRLLETMLDYQRFPPAVRAKAGRTLDRLGDPRPGVGLRPSTGSGQPLPDIAWIKIPERDAQGRAEFLYGEEGELRTEPDFWMAKYPITYRQFQAFVDAPEGMRNPQWWKGLDRKQDKVDEQQFKFWNHPRENVTWYQAMAFCRWLTEKSKADRSLLPGEIDGAFKITLPTEWQWEKAARGIPPSVSPPAAGGVGGGYAPAAGGAGGGYPWGPKYIQGYANVNETRDKNGPHNLQSTSAVGLYPQGRSPYSILDLSGNVWEWCLNEYDKPDRFEEGGSAIRVLRGGSWAWEANRASASARNWFSPDLRLSLLRVSVCRGPQPLMIGCCFLAAEF